MSSSSKSSKVLLLNLGSLAVGEQDFGLPHLVALGSYLQSRLPVRVEILDLGYEGSDLRALLAEIERLGPLLLAGVSCYSSYDHRRARAVGVALRRRFPALPLVVGGYHPSALPGALTGAAGPFDCAVIGEGERPLENAVCTLLGGGSLDPAVGPEVVEDLDQLPPYDWSLLARYWPRAGQHGRKLQIYLSRGCPFRCTFCMERCKAARRWRPFSAQRALDELERLTRVIELRRWVINVADPLFGLSAPWRREVLEEIARRGLLPRQYWTLTRVDALDDEDVRLLRRARFAVGVGLESGSPDILQAMHKTEQPERYLEGICRFAALARRHALPWAANIIVGHPGERAESIDETAAFVRRLFLSGDRTPGWLSVDPFRLYPGSEVFEQLASYGERYGARAPFPRWWELERDAAVAAELIDPSPALTAEERARLMRTRFGELVRRIEATFDYTGRTIDGVFERSLREQVELMSERRCQRTLASMTALRRRSGDREPAPLASALLDDAIVVTDELSAAMEVVAGELRWSGEDDDSRRSRSFLARALSALALSSGESVLLVGVDGVHGAALARCLVGATGRVQAATAERETAAEVRRQLRQAGREVTVTHVDPTRPTRGAREGFDAILVERCVPRIPRALCDRLREGGRMVVAVGPRFRAQRLTLVVRTVAGLETCNLGPISVPPLVGEEGWLRR